MSQSSSEVSRPASTGADWVGRVIGSYRLLRVIGSGGMGTVYQAEHVRMGRRAAVKILRADVRDRPDVARRLQAEARAMACVSHPGIVSILDQDTLPDGTGYLVMEYLAGQSLRDLLRDADPGLSLDAVVTLLHQCAIAMSAAHAEGVIHRDLSPANILCLPQSGRAPRIKILDFGLARIYSPDGASSSSLNTTKDGAVLGTPPHLGWDRRCLVLLWDGRWASLPFRRATPSHCGRRDGRVSHPPDSAPSLQLGKGGWRFV